MRLPHAPSGVLVVALEPPAEPLPSEPLPPEPLSPEPPAVEIPWREREFAIPAGHWLASLGKKVARHVRLPRSAKTGVPGSQHPVFYVDNSPLELVRLKCEEAGMVQTSQVKRGQTVKTIFEGLGPTTAYRFCDVDKYKALGRGSAALMAPPAGRHQSDVLTLAIPPITATHIATKDSWTLKVELYLGVFNSSNTFTLPLKANEIYAGMPDPTELFKRMALKVIREMCESDRIYPVSRALIRLLPPPFPTMRLMLSETESELSSDSELELEESSASE